MKVNITDFAENLDEEVDVYSFHNSLTEEETKELRFVASSFSKYFLSIVKMSPDGNVKIREIVKNFDSTLDSIITGISGTSFSTNATDQYKNLPTIKNLLEEEKELLTQIAFLRRELTKLKTENSHLEKEKNNLKADLEEAREEINRLKRKAASAKSSSSYTSYGGCGGSVSSYGRC